MTANKNSISNLQTQTLQDKINSTYEGIDFNFQGFNHLTDKPSDFIKSGNDAHVNRCLLWLCSKVNDYCRESFKGGKLYNLLGLINNDENLEEWRQDLAKKFNNEFAGDLSIFDLNLKTNNRTVTVTMIVKDVLNNSFFNVSTNATLSE